MELVYVLVLEAKFCEFESHPVHQIKGVGMKSSDVLDRAYGGIPKECTPNIGIEIWPTYRGFRYYWLVCIRKFTR